MARPGWLPTWVRLGPMVPAAAVPAMVWQLGQVDCPKTTAPRRASALVGCAAGACWSCTHLSKSAFDCTKTFICIYACDGPQNSAHWPGKMPTLLGVNHKLLTWFWKTSRLPSSWGIQKLWITSVDVSEKLAVWPTGRCISLKVTMCRLG